MTRNEISQLIRNKESFLCIGLDSDWDRLPSHLKKEEDPVFTFNKQIIDHTHDLAIAYKPNIAFYESLGPRGWESLAKTLEYLKPLRDKLFLIADAKRADIGNTSKQYARTFFDKSAAGLDFDAVTVAPYMGSDSVEPFLEYDNKWVILLGLTSNKGALDFQLQKVWSEDQDSRDFLYKTVIRESQHWADENKIMYVAGATKSYLLNGIREILPHHFLLIPGIGTQGGSIEEVANHGLNNDGGILVNAARSIIFASEGKDFAASARAKALEMQQIMKSLIARYL
ncbi:MAG: orotidine-5'-phosphate decarboxylase [Bacteroidales bacterium]|nr:orotidine-5'-phosphate decarboxylase [Bacteroidales bacterium]